MEISYILKDDPNFCNELSKFLSQFNPNVNWDELINDWKVKNRNQEQIIRSINSYLWIDKSLDYQQNNELEIYNKLLINLKEFLDLQITKLPDSDILYILDYDTNYLTGRVEVEMSNYKNKIIELLTSKLIKFEFIHEKDIEAMFEINKSTLIKLRNIFEVEPERIVFNKSINKDSYIFDFGFLYSSNRIIDFLSKHEKVIHFNYLGIDNYKYLELFRLIYVNLNF